MMGSEGFSWCDTEHLFFRDQHWQDWDTCALCSQADTSTRNYSLYISRVTLVEFLNLEIDTFRKLLLFFIL